MEYGTILCEARDNNNISICNRSTIADPQHQCHCGRVLCDEHLSFGKHLCLSEEERNWEAEWMQGQVEEQEDLARGRGT